MTDVIMPQMGESIAEGTVTKWMKKVGDKVERDEPLFEISTDKVDAEIPSPAAGMLKEIRVEAGATVPINTVVGVIAAEGAAAPRRPRPPRVPPPRPLPVPPPPPSPRRPWPRPPPPPPRCLPPVFSLEPPAAPSCDAVPERSARRSAASAEKPRARDDRRGAAPDPLLAASSARSRPSTTSTSARSRAPASRAA